MRPDCRKRVGKVLGRPIMREEERAIDRRMRRAVKALRRTEPGWADMTKMQRLDRAAAFAGDTFETEMQQYRMPVPKKGAPLSEEARQAERDRQQRADETFPIRAVRGVRFVRRDGNPADTELTGGRWFTDRPETANTYSGEAGGDMATASMPVRLRLRNPLVVDARNKRFDGIPREWLPEDVQKQAIRGKLLSTDDIAKAAKAMGYDGVIFENLKDDLTSNALTTKPATVYAVFDRKNIRSEFAQFDPAKSEDAGLLFQSAANDQNNLFVAHNTSEEKLRKTLELGGMPMPSLAVARTDKGGFAGYGEITFLADPRILNEKDVTAYDADIYSPRVPQALPEYDEAEAAKFIKEAKPSIPEDAGILPYLSLDEMTSDLPYELSHSDFVRAAYLAEQGRLPKLKKLKVPPAVRKAMDLEWMSDDWKALAIEHFQKMEDEFNAARVEAGREPINLHFEDDGTLSRRSLNEFDNLIRKARKSQYDQEAFQREIYKRTVGTQAARKKFQNYTTALATRITKGKRMFAGFSYSGNRRFKAFNLENIMQEMRKEMREGQRDAFGGEGSIRARVAAAPMRTMRDVQKARDRIVSSEELEQIKKENNNRFFELTEQLQPFYKFSASGMEYMDAVADAIADGPRGWRESFDADAIPLIQEYVDHLRSLPTEYFEAKANRIMRVNDFAVAIVPRNISPDVKKALQDAGVQLRFYKKGDEADRLRAIRQQDGLLFQTIAPTYYSALTNFVAASQQTEATAEQWKQMIVQPARTVRSAKRDPATNRVVVGEDGQPIMLERTVPEVYAPNVTPEEVEWTGVMEWLDLQEGPVTREDLVAFLEQNGVKVEEVVKGGIGPSEQAQREILPLIEERDRLQQELNSRTELDGNTDSWGGLFDGAEAVLNTDDGKELFDRIQELSDQISGLQQTIDADIEADNTQWSSWTLPGGENYREMLLTLPAPGRFDGEITPEMFRQRAVEMYGERYADNLSEAQKAIVERAIRGEGDFVSSDAFRSSHWSEPNVLAHVRFKERVTADGQRTLALEEIQSDWHQAGRKRGYNRSLTDAEKSELQSLQDERDAIVAQYSETGNLVGARSRMTQEERVREREITSRITEIGDINRGVPNAPFKNNAWANLVLKRMIRYAAENGFDSVSWIPGNIQNGQEVDAEDGRSDFYDKIIPNLANKLGKKYGARVEKVAVPLDAAPAKTGWEVAGEQPAAAQPARAEQFWSLPITEEMRQDALEKGFALFQRGDPKGWGETTPPPDLPPMRLNLAYTRDAYGDDAVKRLPAPIRERAASGSSINSMLETIKAVKKTLKRKPPKTLTKWINAKRRGYGSATVSSPTSKGINGIKGAAGELRAMGLEKLINEKSGTDLDYVREAAIEDGFLPEGATVNDLLAAMDAESRGEPTYSRFDEAGVLDLQAAEAWEKMFDDAGINIFEDSDKDLRKKLSDFVSSQNDDAVTPDQAAEKFGFGSGEELLNALANIGNRERYIAEQVRREMQQEFGDPFNDGTLTEKARVMVESELRARAGEIELEALARAVGEVAATRMAKEMARDTLQMLTVKELAQWRRYQQAERREMENAMEAIKRGDAVQAFIHKRRQMVNMHLAREGEKLFEQIEKTRKHLLTYENSKTKRERLVKAGQSYVDQMDDLLDRYRLRKEGPKARRAAESLHAWATQQLVEMDPLKHLKPFKDNENIDSEESEADPLAGLADIGPDEQIQAEQDLEKFRALKRAKEEASGIPYTDLTAEDFFTIRQQADHIYHLAKLKTNLLADQKKRSFLQVVSEVTESILSNKARDAAQDPIETDIPKEKRKRQFRDYMAAHRTLLSLARQMDGGKDGGPVQMLLVYPLSKAFADRAAVWREMEQGIQKMFSMYSNAEKRAMFQRNVNIPAINQTMTKQGVLAVALNMGTEKNRQRMMDSEGWSLEQLYAIVESLDQRDWRFVQGVWEYLGSWFPKADEVHKRVHGVGMDKVEPVEVITKFGVLEGGYYPIVFDPVRSSKTMQRQLESEARAQAGRVGARSQAGFTKRRAEGKVTIPVRYSVLDVILGHLSDVADSITVQEPLMDVGRIVVHPDFEAAVKQKYGSGIYRQIILALRESKQGQEVAKDETEKALVHLRNGQTIVGLGLRFSTAALQVFGLSNSAVRIGSYWLYKGILRNGMSAFEREKADSFVAERSSMMVNRRNAMTREIADLRNNFKGDRTPGWVKESYFWMITVMQYHLVDMPTWLGQYEKAIVNGFEESDAIAQADLAVQEAQGTGEIYGLAGIQRGSPLLKLFTNFLSYMITTANLATERTAATNFRNAAQVANWALDMTMLMIFPVVTKMMLDALLKGIGPDEDDDETWLGLYAKEQASFLMSMNFFPAQVAGALGGYSYDGPTGTAALKEIQTSLSRVTDGDGDVIEVWRPALAAAGAIFHLPTGQIDTSIRGIQGLASGESEDYSDIVFGPSPETREAMRN